MAVEKARNGYIMITKKGATVSTVLRLKKEIIILLCILTMYNSERIMSACFCF